MASRGDRFEMAALLQTLHYSGPIVGGASFT